MNKQIIVICFFVMLLSCAKKAEVKPFPFDDFIFSSGDLHHIVSIN